MRGNVVVVVVVIMVLFHKDIGVDSFVLFHDGVCFQRVEHGGYMGSLQGARATAG
jgi:hypothetical protein